MCPPTPLEEVHRLSRVAEGIVDVEYPGSSPWATAVGGVSLVLGPDRHIRFQTGWGTNFVYLSSSGATGSTPIDPPEPVGAFDGLPPSSFLYGSGGGASNIYAKPAFQSSVPGDRRLVPDISWVADPFTPGQIVLTVDAQGDQVVSYGGGTSLSCPMFSALWGIATQRAGGRLGQAAALVYGLGPDAITDVTPVDSGSDVTGTIQDASGASPLSKWQLAAPLQNSPPFVSAFTQAPDGTWVVVTFGTDTTLGASQGWDNVTGVGTPNGAAFVEAIALQR